MSRRETGGNGENHMKKWMVYAKRADFNRIGQQFQIDPVIARIIRNRLTQSRSAAFCTAEKTICMIRSC